MSKMSFIGSLNSIIKLTFEALGVGKLFKVYAGLNPKYFLSNILYEKAMVDVLFMGSVSSLHRNR